MERRDRREEEIKTAKIPGSAGTGAPKAAIAEQPGTLTIVAVRLVLVLCVGQGEGRVGAAGQAGAAAGLDTPAPESHGVLWRHHRLVFRVRVGPCTERVPSGGQPHLRTKRQASSSGWFAHS